MAKPPPDELAPWLGDFAERRDREKRRLAARSPQKADRVVAKLLARRGYGNVLAESALVAAWQQAAGELFASQTRVGQIRRGVLTVTVSSSLWMQELTFERDEILARLQGLAGKHEIRALRFVLGTVST